MSGGSEATGTSRELLVFRVRRDTRCGECQTELEHGSLLYLDGERALCLTCADLDRLDNLPRGDAALTRRARAHSPLQAVVLEWSRSRKRYERQGVLVDPDALRQAVRLAVVAHVRHVHTSYDRLLGQTGDRQLAREEVRERVDTVLSDWQQPTRSGKQSHSVAHA